ncbi:RNA-binding protein, putative [Trypanosoma equiperdum]|uniref:RRM domain-containing protein n=2 Tax=Trypanozoon TaxID=39700 RepID=Q387L6_TRYB2|nr:hypothetical protein, conserved [Trypanosoma brucei brucei TREU927]EAN79015.1 hypothetical protein, conserved [Trypanosoma brucei brucei TREU927]SCU67758.1 RNA-binding protein, putative [Trypanosoma equiperdum]
MEEKESDSSFVYVNGEKFNLLEDGRLALYPRLPEGTLLFDPGNVPPQEVPLSTDATERGVTACRLLPYAHYEAYVPDPATGDLVPVTGGYVCAYVSNLPPNTTAEMLGRFFEAFDMVAEADIFTDPTGACTGRGWVVLQDPAKLLLVPPVMEFFPRNFIHVALSDIIPTPAMFRSITESLLQPPSSVADLGPQLKACIDQCGNGKHVNNTEVRKGDGLATMPILHAPLDTSVVNLDAYYFVVVMSREDAERSVEAGFFRTEPENQRAFYKVMDRGPVIIIVVLQRCSAVFGFGQLLSPVDDGTGDSLCFIQWMKHGVFLEETDLRGPQSVPLSKMRDGIPLKPEIGEGICYLASGYLPTAAVQDMSKRDARHGRQRPAVGLTPRQTGGRQMVRPPLLPVPRGQMIAAQNYVKGPPVGRNGGYGGGKAVLNPRRQF